MTEAIKVKVFPPSDHGDPGGALLQWWDISKIVYASELDRVIAELDQVRDQIQQNQAAEEGGSDE